MSIRIPLTSQPQPAVTAATAGGLRLGLPVAIGASGATTSARELQALRAVAAAAALADPKKALEIVKVAKDTPGAPIGKVKIDDLAPVLQEVVHVQEDRSRAPSAGERQVAVARAIGADSALVAAAFSEVDGNAAATESSLNWVASVDPALLERAANAAARETLFDLIPSQQTRLERIEKRLDGVEERVKKLEDAGRNAGWQI